MVGYLFCLNDILLPSLITHFRLNYTQATMIQVAFYLTYMVFPIPIAWMIQAGATVDTIMRKYADADLGQPYLFEGSSDGADSYDILVIG